MAFVSIIVPCYNEQQALPIFVKALKQVKFDKATKLELNLIDDGSSDDTLKIIKNLAAKYNFVHYISFSRNFGKESGILAGLKMSTGDYITVMDADLQDPPDLLPQMIKLLDTHPDLDVIQTRRVDRTGDPGFKSKLSSMFYKVANKLMTVQMPLNVRDFRLMRRNVAQAIINLPENSRFIKGMFSWVGFHTKTISYKNVSRSSGESHYSTWTLFKYALTGLVDFSSFFLQLPLYFAFLVLLVALIVLPLHAYALSVLLLAVSLVLFGQAVICMYLGKIYLQDKKRPVYIVRETNLTQDPNSNRKENIPNV